MVFAVGNRSRNSRDACKGARGWGSPGGIMVSVVCCGVFKCINLSREAVGADLRTVERRVWLHLRLASLHLKR